MDESGEEGFAGAGFTDYEQRCRALGKGGNPLSEPDDGGAASYDLEGIQSSGPEEAEQCGPQGE